jgi:hypothetical protein
MTNHITDVLYKHFESHIEKHRMNVLIMLENPRAIHDHTDFIGAVELELKHIAEYLDMVEALDEVLR